jgi:valacyclovir hydrolase
MPKLKLADFAIHYETLGSGPPLVLIPGSLGTGQSDFHKQLEPFSKDFTVIAPDPRGYGRSRPPQRDYPLNFYQRDAEDILALMAALGHDTFAIMGWSDGANIGALLAATYAHHVTSLVMWGGNSFLTPHEIEAFQSMRSISTWSPRSAEPMRLIYGDSLDALWERYVDGLENLYAHGGDTDIYLSQLPHIHAPTLILHGELDPLVPGTHPRIIHHGITGSELYVFPEGKHNIHVRYAEEFNQIVSSFLKRKPAQ